MDLRKLIFTKILRANLDELERLKKEQQKQERSLRMQQKFKEARLRRQQAIQEGRLQLPQDQLSLPSDHSTKRKRTTDDEEDENDNDQNCSCLNKRTRFQE